MKYFVIFAGILAVTLAAPQGHRTTGDSQTTVVDEGVKESSDGQIHSQVETLKDFGGGKQVMAVQGSLSFEGPGGKIYLVNYTFDENGFHCHLVLETASKARLIDPKTLLSLLG